MIQANDEQAVIRQLQTMLRSIQIARGDVVTVPVDGIYDTATRDAVEQIQHENGLAVTGKVDLETYNLIYGMALEADFAASEPMPLYAFPKGRTLSAGEVSDLVILVQVILNALTDGYDDHPHFKLDGAYTDDIAAAIRRFQMRNGIPPTGDVDKLQQIPRRRRITSRKSAKKGVRRKSSEESAPHRAPRF